MNKSIKNTDKISLLLIFLLPLTVYSYQIRGEEQPVKLELRDHHTGEPIDSAKVSLIDFHNLEDTLTQGYTNSDGIYINSYSGIEEKKDLKKLEIIQQGINLNITANKVINGGIYNISGSLVKKIKGQNIELNVSDLRAGLYLINVLGYESVKLTFPEKGFLIPVNKKGNENNENLKNSVPLKKNRGNPLKRRSPLDSIKLVIEHPDFWQRITYRLVDLADDTTNIYETMITNDTTIFNIDCFEEMTWRQNLGGLRKWGKDAVIAIDTTGFNQSTINLTLDNAPAAANALTKGTVSGDYVSLMNRHTDGLSQDTIWVYYDPRTPGGTGGSVSGDPDVYNAGSMHLNNTVTAEYVWNEMGGALGLHDSNKKQSVMNDPPQYAHLTPHDSLVVEFMYGNDKFGFPGRPLRNKYPDEDPVPEGW